MHNSYIFLRDSSVVSFDIGNIKFILISIIVLEFQSLLKGERVSHQQEEVKVMISGESSAQPSPPLPYSHQVTAELEGSTLTRAQYNTICSLTSSLLLIPTGDLVYDGHTLNPLTLHWHCPPINHGISIFLSLFTEMAQEGIKMIHWMNGELIIPHLNVSISTLCSNTDVHNV